MPYLKVSITTQQETAETLSDTLTALGALSVSMQDAADEAIFQIELDDSPLWKKVRIDALFKADTSTQTILQALQTNNPKENDFHIEKVEDKDWVRLTQENFPPKEYGEKLWVCPTWCDTKMLTGVIVKINPGLAFGTGTHPTTALCLEWLTKHPPINNTVIDYGCGSGILTLAALALGAKKAWAIDHDPQALEATHANAALNHFDNTEKLEVLLPEAYNNIHAPVVIANILANPLIALAPELIKLVEPGGKLILSGILENEIKRVSAAYSATMRLTASAVEDGWGLLELSWRGTTSCK